MKNFISKGLGVALAVGLATPAVAQEQLFDGCPSDQTFANSILRSTCAKGYT